MPRLWILAALGCGGPPPPPPPLAHHTTPAPLPAPVVDPRCPRDVAFHRETLVRGRETEIARGKRATYLGQSTDHYDDGSFAMLLSLEIFGQPWMPDARDRSLHAIGEHCIRIVTSADARLELDVALQPAHEYDSHRCEMGCCSSQAQSRTPDGTDECCFCADDPTP